MMYMVSDVYEYIANKKCMLTAHTHTYVYNKRIVLSSINGTQNTGPDEKQ